jgi:hypothetical protein
VDETEPTESKAKVKNDLVVENVDNESTEKEKEVITHGKVLLEYLFSYLYRDETYDQLN